MPSHYPCSPVIHEWSWKKTPMEKKYVFSTTSVKIPFRLEEEVLFFYLYLAKQIKDHIIKKIKMLDAQSD